MRIAISLLLASTACIAAPAAAQDAPLPNDEAAHTEAGEEEAIVVFGRGETRQVQTISDTAIEYLAPGTTPQRAIERLPGVNFQSADPFGAYEWSQRVSIRSFNQNQLGFTLDGIPLGDGSYGNHNGLHVSRAVISENVGSVRVSQGAGSIGTQATNNLGGTIETFTRRPTGRPGFDVALTYGSEETVRAFGRVEFGSEDGARGYVSALYANADKWKGEGEQQQRQLNVALVVPLGGAEFDVWYAFSRRNEQDYQDLSLEMINRLGYDWDNFGVSQYALAVRVADIANNRGETGAAPTNVAAGTVYPAPIRSVDDAYLDAAGIRRDHLGAIGLTVPVGAEGEFRVRGYYHNNRGQGLWGTPYVSSPSGSPFSIRTTEYDMERIGVFGSLNVPVAGTDLTVGLWYEQNDFEQARRFYGLTSRTIIGRSFQEFQSNPFFTQWEFAFSTETLQYYVQDRIELGALTVNLGWKGFRVSNEATAIISGGRAAGDIKVEDWFQPHVGFAYELSDQAEIFGGFTQVTRAFASATTTGPFATTQAGFNAIRDTLEPETSDTYELGLRYRDPVINAVVAGYLVNFQNRLLALSTGAGIVGNPAILQNVGSVRAYGVEAAVDLRLGGGFTLYGAYAYNRATYEDNVRNAAGAIVAATEGRTVVDSPEHILRGEAGYDNGSIFARLSVGHMSSRFFNFENDRSVPGRTLVDATLGYRLNDRTELQLNATNLFDEEYVSTIGSNGFGNRGDSQTLLAGSPRQVFVTLRFGL